MTVDQFIDFLSILCSKLLPICGVILLIYLIVMIRKIVQVLKGVEGTLKIVDETIGTTHEQIRKLDAPLNTVGEISQTIDHIHEMSQNAVKSALVAIISNLNVIRDWLFAQLSKEEMESDVQKEDTAHE